MIHALRASVCPRSAAHACACMQTATTAIGRSPASASASASASARIAAAAVSRSIRSISSLTADPRYVDSAAAPPNFSPASAVVYSEAISEQEADALVQDIQLRMKRRRYEKGHWDAVITMYKEVELPLPTESSVGGGSGGGPQPLSDLSATAIARIRNQLERNHFGPDGSRDQEGRTRDQLPINWIPCHGIDLKKDGKLTAHVDSVRYSGLIVAGLSLLSSSIMRLRPAAEYNNIDTTGGEDGTTEKQQSQQHLYEPKATESPGDGHVDLYLPPRSLYVLSGMSRYEYTHELLDDGSMFELAQGGGDDNENAIRVTRDRRISVIFRDAKKD